MATQTRRASIKRCTTCRREVVHGFDRDTAGLPITVEPTPVSLRAAQALDSIDWPVAVLSKEGTLWLSVGRDLPSAFPGESFHPEHRCPAG